MNLNGDGPTKGDSGNPGRPAGDGTCEIPGVADWPGTNRAMYQGGCGASGGWGSTPRIQRSSVIPNSIGRSRRRRAATDRIHGVTKSSGELQVDSDGVPSPGWQRAASRRRALFAAVVSVQTAVATWSLAQTFPYPGLKALEIAMLATFVVLFAWISFGFWTFVIGLWLEWRNRPGRFTIAQGAARHDPAVRLRSRTAILVPICNEDVARVTAGIGATWRSLALTGQLDAFDVFILSDSSDPDRQVEEELAWNRLCRELNGYGRIFYRHRRNNIKRKSGNIADFLRRWGRAYDYMIVLDADSVLTGDALIRLARIMEEHPRAGIVQTVPVLIRSESLFARTQQFASRVYGRILARGAGFLQLGESYYWGHNAILRVGPFMEHCILPRLSGTPPLGGEILSHDFVEAALMARGGFEVWIVEDLEGSYEETPPSLHDELKRDRRWCQGNLQHLRLIFGNGMRAGHRTIFSSGVMTYASALIWLLFLGLSSVWIAVNALTPPVYFSGEPSLFPSWPQWRPEWAIALFSTTAVLLFTPKLLALILIVRRGQAPLFGGVGPLSASIVLEILLSALLAPVRMWFHAKFVLLTLMGRDIKWAAQQRAGNEIGWPQALRAHGFSAAFALAWMAAIVSLDPLFSWWLVPITVPLIVSPALSVCLSRVEWGRRLRDRGLLTTPEELNPPAPVRILEMTLAAYEPRPAEPTGLVRVVADPSAHAVHVRLLRGKSAVSAGGRARNQRLRRKFLQKGPGSLGAAEKSLLLRDAESLRLLQQEFWRSGHGGPDVTPPAARRQPSFRRPSAAVVIPGNRPVVEPARD